MVLSVIVNGSGFEPEIGNFTSSSDFVTPDRIFTLSCIVNDLDGKETIENVSIELSEGVILLWKNETDSFSMVQNLHNYARLESGSYSETVNSSAHALNFKLSYRVSMAHGPVSVLAENTKVYDNSTLCGFGNYTSLFIFGPEPEAWQQKPSDIPQSGHVIGIEETAVILVVSLIIIAILSLFASRHKKSTKEKYHEMIDVHPKRRNE